MRSGNPALNAHSFETFRIEEADARMSIEGTTMKTGILLFLAIVGAAISWTQVAAGGAPMPWMAGGAIGGLLFAVVTVFKPTWAPVTAPIYALLEGLFLGAVSLVFEAQFPGIATQAVMLTFGTLLCMLLAYGTGLIRATEKFKIGIVAATGGIMLVYIVSLVLSFFNVSIPLIHSSGWIGIGFSLFVVVIAALNLVLDFDFIETGVERGAPKYMEWYGAFGLMVTLVWLYLEILRLLAKLQSRD